MGLDLFDFLLFFELLLGEGLSDKFLFGLEYFDFLELFIFGFLEVEFDVLDGGVVEGESLTAGRD
jgi:hypothetical protein